VVYDAIVIGAGAGGLFAAAIAGRRGKRVLVLEHSNQPGAKILISGGGRCNFTNRRVTAAQFISGNPHFAKSALARFTPDDFLSLVTKHHIRYHEKTPGQLFCDSSARLILELLMAECAASQVEIRTGCKVEAVRRDTRFIVETSLGRFEAGAVVVATGGLSIPKLGATDFGYRLARQFGLKVVEPYPALVPLVFDGPDRKRWSDLAGVATGVVASCGGASFDEKMLFTHKGVSGPAILQLSSYWRKGATVTVDLLPGRVFDPPPHEARKALALALPQRLAERWLEVEGFPQPVLPVRAVDTRLHDWTFVPSGTEGFEKAEVTGGGVSTAELSSKTMEARNAAGLYFVGEVVDVTGWLGGYNFQWAWASAHAAGEAI
jgi:predicted Rossmann fold flavoprotein